MPQIREDWRHTTQKSMKLRRHIRECIDMSQRTIGQNYSKWDYLEGTYRAWKLTDEEDRESLEKHGVQKIIVPIQFATIQTVLTFLMEIFTALEPVLKVGPAEPSSTSKARVMETCLGYDYRGNRGYFMLNQFFFNILRYGYGIIRNEWAIEQVLRKTLIQSPRSRFDIPGAGTFNVPGNYELGYDYFTTFEGNKWSIVDNRQFFPDPRWPLSRFQEGNFVFERDLIHDTELFDLEEQGLFFNTTLIRNLSTSADTRTAGATDGSHNRDDFGNRYSIDNILTEARKNKMHVREKGVIKIVPKDFGISREERPIDYLVELVDDQHFVRVEPSVFQPRFPYSVGECYPDTLAFLNQGMMELTAPLSAHLDFLFNSHMANVRKAVNDRFLGDPSRLDLEDFLNPDNVVIRLLPQAYGTNPAEALQQLNVVDITKSHLQDSQSILDLWEKITGASSHMFGQISSGRRTAFELQGVFRQAGARMKMLADLISATGMASLTEQMSFLRAENMEYDQYIEIAGQTAADLGVRPEEIMEGFLKVNKSHVNGVFKFPASLGVLPHDRAAAAECLDQLFQTVVQAPFLMQAFDPIVIFKELIRQKGLTNMDDFLSRGLKAQTMIMTPDQIASLQAANKIQPTDMMTNNARDREQPLSLNGMMSGAGASYDKQG